jgi:hypothetical protein
MTLKDILQFRERITSLFDVLVEHAHVVSRPDRAIFLWANETEYAPFSIIYLEAESK